jgi:hypothetical protein
MVKLLTLHEASRILGIEARTLKKRVEGVIPPAAEMNICGKPTKLYELEQLVLTTKRPALGRQTL